MVVAQSGAAARQKKEIECRVRPRAEIEWLSEEARKAEKVLLKRCSMKVISCIIWRHGLKELHPTHLRLHTVFSSISVGMLLPRVKYRSNIETPNACRRPANAGHLTAS